LEGGKRKCKNISISERKDRGGERISNQRAATSTQNKDGVVREARGKRVETTPSLWLHTLSGVARVRTKGRARTRGYLEIRPPTYR